MKSLYVFTCFTCALVINALPVDYKQGTLISQPKPGSPVDEVIVESSLHIKNKKNQGRRTREAEDVALLSPRSLRVKREPRKRQTDEQATANAASHANFFGPEGFGASAANAQAQAFRSRGGFGANAANTQTQSLDAGLNGIHGSAGATTSQVYQLPNGKTINVAITNGFSTGPNGIAGSNANGITITK